MNELSGLIDQLLTERRPDRYKKEGGDEWLDDIADEIAPMIPEAVARQVHARTLVGNRETDKLRVANKHIRDFYKTGQLSFPGWQDLCAHPIAVAGERVALRACTPEDLRQSAQKGRREAKNQADAHYETCDGEEWLADVIEQQGKRFLGEIDLPSRP